MARSRNIKPGFFLNDELAQIDPLGRLLFAGLWTIADREGRLEDRPKRIKAEVLPYDDCDVDDLLNKLAEREFIIRYEVNGEKYIQVVNFIKHQNPHYKEVPSEIPAPEGYIDSEYKSPPPTEAERQAIFKRDGFKCIICGATDNLTLDHIIPRSKGGTSEPENLQTLCKRCNTSKGNKLDFMSAQQEGNGGLTSIQPRTELEPNSVRDGTLIPDSLNLIPDSLNPITTTDSFNFNPAEIDSRSRQLVEKFENGFGRLLNEIEAAKVTAWAEEFDPELVEHALETAVLGNNRSCKYIGGILNNWHDKGVKCVQDAHDLERRFQDRKKNGNQTNDRASPETKQFYVPPEVLSDLMNSG